MVKNRFNKINKILILAIAIIFIALLISAVLIINSYLTIKKDKTDYDNSDNNKQKINCLPEQRNSDFCIEIYKPVCGYRQVQCVTTPCDPVPETFSNSCFACAEDSIIYYTKGECSR